MKRKLLLISNIIGTGITFVYLTIIIQKFFWIIDNTLAAIHESAALQPDASATGIIGGADGPTAIFITGKCGLNFTMILLLPLVMVGILLICNSIYLAKNRK
jgi:Na+-transporting methylmalonyl-CoA/oxaloacetate decarboxylase beta subunit